MSECCSRMQPTSDTEGLIVSTGVRYEEMVLLTGWSGEAYDVWDRPSVASDFSAFVFLPKKTIFSLRQQCGSSP